MTRYAESTTVTPAKSRLDIEATLRRYGADSFMFGQDPDRGLVAFSIKGRMVRLSLPLPDRKHPSIRLGSNGYARTARQIEAAYEQSERQRWRALLLVIKAKLEAVESGISTVEQEFLAGLLLPDGSTVAEWAGPQIEQAYVTGAMPSRLPGLAAPREVAK